MSERRDRGTARGCSQIGAIRPRRVYDRGLSSRAAPTVELDERRWIMSAGGVPVHRVRGRARAEGAPLPVRLELTVHRPGEDAVVLPVMELEPAPLVASGAGTVFAAAFLVPRGLVSSGFDYEVGVRVAAPVAAPPPVARRQPVAAAPVPRRRRPSRTLAVALVACGIAFVSDAVLTMVWKDPVTSLYTERAQASLRDRLAQQTRVFVTTRVSYPPDPHEHNARPGGQARRAAHFASIYARAAQTGQPLGKIRIPKIGLDMVFVQGTGDAQLRQGPAHYAHTAMPGQSGTVGIAGHRTTYQAPFRDLDQLRSGDPIELETPYGTFTYAVEGHAVVAPTYVDILDPSWTTQRLVLTSCHPVRSAAERIVVVARLRRMKVI